MPAGSPAPGRHVAGQVRVKVTWLRAEPGPMEPHRNPPGRVPYTAVAWKSCAMRFSSRGAQSSPCSRLTSDEKPICGNRKAHSPHRWESRGNCACYCRTAHKRWHFFSPKGSGRPSVRQDRRGYGEPRHNFNLKSKKCASCPRCLRPWEAPLHIVLTPEPKTLEATPRGTPLTLIVKGGDLQMASHRELNAPA